MKKLILTLILLSSLIGVGLASWLISSPTSTKSVEITPVVDTVDNWMNNSTN